jgi:hypothetical protein
VQQAPRADLVAPASPPTFFSPWSKGSIGDYPGYLWGVHGLSVDQDGNLYVAEVDSGRVQKFTPRPGATPLSS